MASRAERIKALADAIGADVKALKLANGDLSTLTTTNKTDLVKAINEIVTLTGQPQGAQIDDTATGGATGVVWSANKVFDAIIEARTAIRDEITNGAGSALDTLKELADALGNNPNLATDIATQMTKRVRVDAAQGFTTAEKLQGCENLGLGNPDYDFVAAYVAAKV